MMTVFETEPCTRCGGCGQYSHCQNYGTKCFKCAGSGLALTKRGKAAYQFFRKPDLVAVEDVKIGDLLEFDIFDGVTLTKFAAHVEGIEQSETKYQDKETGQFVPGISVTTTRPKTGEPCGFVAWPGEMVKRGHTKAERQNRIAAALEYQSTLTKAGKPRKRSVADA